MTIMIQIVSWASFDTLLVAVIARVSTGNENLPRFVEFFKERAKKTVIGQLVIGVSLGFLFVCYSYACQRRRIFSFFLITTLKTFVFIIYTYWLFLMHFCQYLVQQDYFLCI
jgi:hypothetical protein